MANSLDTCSSCGGDVSNVRLEKNSNNVTLQVGSGRQDVIESVSKNSAQAGIGVSATGPKFNGKIGNSSEVKSAINEVDSVSVNIPLESDPTIVWVENPDPDNEDVISGCSTEGCDNNIYDRINIRIEEINNISKNIGVNDSVGKQDVIEMMDDKSFVDPSTLSFDKISSANESENKEGIDRYVDKVKDGVGTTVSKARSGASSTATRVRDGVSSTVDAVKQRFGSDDQDSNQNSNVASTAESPEQDNTVAPTDETHAEEAKLHVSPSEDTDVDTAFNNGAVNLALEDDAAAVEGTTIHVTLDDDIPDVSPGDDGSVTVGLGDGAGTTMEVSPGANDEADRSFGDGNIQLAFDDGDVRVSPGDNDIQMETGDNGDVQMAVGEESITSEPSNDPATEHKTQSKERDSSPSMNEAETNGSGSTSKADIDFGNTGAPEHADQWLSDSDGQSTDERENGHDRDKGEETDTNRDDDSTPSGGGLGGIG